MLMMKLLQVSLPLLKMVYLNSDHSNHNLSFEHLNSFEFNKFNKFYNSFLEYVQS